MIVTLSGQAQNGKDTSAIILKKHLEDMNYSVIIIHFADYLKYLCKEYFGWNGIKDKEGREILQRIGTDIVRSRNPDFWVKTIADFIDTFGEDYDYILIPDCRFPNEVNYFKQHGYLITSLYVERTDFENNLTAEQRKHPSERAMDGFKFDWYIKDVSGLDFLEKNLSYFINFLMLRRVDEGL